MWIIDVTLKYAADVDSILRHVNQVIDNLNIFLFHMIYAFCITGPFDGNPPSAADGFPSKLIMES